MQHVSVCICLGLISEIQLVISILPGGNCRFIYIYIYILNSFCRQMFRPLRSRQCSSEWLENWDMSIARWAINTSHTDKQWHILFLNTKVLKPRRASNAYILCIWWDIYIYIYIYIYICIYTVHSTERYLSDYHSETLTWKQTIVNKVFRTVIGSNMIKKSRTVKQLRLLNKTRWNFNFIQKHLVMLSWVPVSILCFVKTYYRKSYTLT